VRIEAAACRTALGDAAATHAALCAGQRGLTMQPVLGGRGGGDPVPLACWDQRSLDETAPPNWLPCIDALAAEIPAGPWGDGRHPVFLTSSNFGVGSQYAFQQTKDPRHLAYGTPFAVAEVLRQRLGWGENVAVLSHACVSAHLGLVLAARAIEQGWAERALVFSFDFISPFVAGGFHALKILNSEWPAPYAVRPTGAIGLGDGAAFAALGPGRGGFMLSAPTLHNEMHHFTANRSDGAGFATCLGPVAAAAAGQRVWVKGHGTGTLEAGKLEAEAVAALFPGSPLVSWKGSIGHTLGSCGLVELAVALAAIEAGRIPGTVGSAGPCVTAAVATEPFALAGYQGVVLASNAFGGAHAACLLSHD
jgi:3-oxoacyl-(acyl-carrier-protein) synthase